MGERDIPQFKNRIIGKKIALLGMGISNTSLLKFISKINSDIDITVFDMAEEEQLKETISLFENYKNVNFVLGKNYLNELKGFDIIFKTPVIRYDIPELIEEREKGAYITSEMEMFMELCPAEIIGVTGSDGKTTTTTIIYNILREAGFKCWLGGNIGTPLIDKVEEIKNTDKVIVELSSFQLHTMTKSPDIAVITNISPNHLDVHKSMEEYIDAKKNIFRHQNCDSILVLNNENYITKGFAFESKGHVRYFSSKNIVKNGTYLKDNVVLYRGNGYNGAKGKGYETAREIMNVETIRLPGIHNIENYLAATAAVAHFADNSAINKTAFSFKGAEHRNEYIGEINGVGFYNDSIGSSPTRTIATVNSFDKKIILIAGGYDKKISYDILGKTISEKVKALILIGQTAPLIEAALGKEVRLTGKGKNIPIIKCNTLEEAVYNAYSQTVKGDIVLLSPASASFDMFRNFEERGKCFKNIVGKLGSKSEC